MAVLYITSITEKAGKTMLALGLGKSWLDSGKSVGYLKLDGTGQSNYIDKDYIFIQKILALKEPVETLCLALKADNVSEIKTTLSNMGQTRDVIIIEGMPLTASSGIVESLEAKVLIIHDYSFDLGKAIPEYQKIGRRLLGIVVNKVPRRVLGRVSSQYADKLSEVHLKLLGVVPENRTLMAPSILDLAEAVQGKILSNNDQASELIENLMMGSSTFDRGAAYYNRKSNKAVILWGERPGFRKAALANLQLAALQTSTKCLIISASGAPIPAVIQKAGEKQVPIISAPGNVPALITALENAMGQIKFNQEKKLPELLEVLPQNLNLATLSQLSLD
jgi:uncharacterized protein